MSSTLDSLDSLEKAWATEPVKKRPFGFVVREDLKPILDVLKEHSREKSRSISEVLNTKPFLTLAMKYKQELLDFWVALPLHDKFKKDDSVNSYLLGNDLYAFLYALEHDEDLSKFEEIAFNLALYIDKSFYEKQGALGLFDELATMYGFCLGKLSISDADESNPCVIAKRLPKTTMYLVGRILKRDREMRFGVVRKAYIEDTGKDKLQGFYDFKSLTTEGMSKLYEDALSEGYA